MESSNKLRSPVVAGAFYPKEAKSIEKEIGRFIGKAEVGKIKGVGCILPHAGYMYSGKVAANTLRGLVIPEKVILIGPNHTGNGPLCSIMAEGEWETPLGRVKIDGDLARLLLSKSKDLENDYLAHIEEHSLEVELPILQYFRKDFEIVPITLMTQDTDTLKDLGEDLANVLSSAKYGGKTLILASSDMTHYESEEQARGKDMKAIKDILALDEEKLAQDVRDYGISMCGFASVYVMLVAAKSLGAKNAKLISYQTSGDVTGDKTSVVGYAGLIIN